MGIDLNISQFVFLVTNHLRSSVKSIFLSSIGLIIALSLVASSSIYIETQSLSIFQQETQRIQDENHYLDLGIILFRGRIPVQNLENQQVNYDLLFQQISDVTESEIQEYGFERIFNALPLRLEFDEFNELRYNNTIINTPVVLDNESIRRFEFSIYQLNTAHWSFLTTHFNVSDHSLKAPNDAIWVGDPDLASIEINQTCFAL